MEEVAADKARREWEEAFDLAIAARQHANKIQDAAGKAVGLARLLEEACPTAKNVAQGMAKISETVFWEKRKHKQQKEAGKAVSMDGEDNEMNKGQMHIEKDENERMVPVLIMDETEKKEQLLILTRADADAEKASRAWRETHELADLAIENATRMKRRAAEAVSLAKDLEAKSAKAKAVAQRTAHIAETALLKKRKHEEQEVFLLAEQTWGGMVAARLGCFLALREPPNPTVATGCFLGPARTTKPCKLRYKTASTSQIPRKLQCSAPFGGVLGPFWGRSGGLSVRFWVILS